MSPDIVFETTSIRSYVREVYDEDQTLSNEEFVNELIRRIPSHEQTSILTRVLRDVLPMYLNRITSSAEKALAAVHAGPRGFEGRAPISSSPSTNLSPRSAGISEYRMAFFKTRIPGTIILVGRATYDDLVLWGNREIEHGESAILNGKKRLEWAQALRENGVEFLEELPEEVLTKLEL